MNIQRKFILKSEDTELVLPITPSEYEVQTSVEMTKTSIVQLGEINIAGGDKLGEIKIISFFPANEYAFANSTDTDPAYYITQIENWLRNKEVIQFIVSGTGVNRSVLIDSFSYGENDGTNDVQYMLTLQEYRETETVEVAGWTVPKRKKNRKKKDEPEREPENPPEEYEPPTVTEYYNFGVGIHIPTENIEQEY